MSTDPLTSNKKTTIDEVEPRKPARRILEQEIAEGLNELERSTAGLLLSGLSAGLDLGFSVFLMAVMLTNAQGLLAKPIVEILVAHMYTVGFIFVVIGRSELFTEHTTLAILPVLDQRASVKALARLWGLVFVSNLVGGGIFAFLAAKIGPALGVINPTVFRQIAGDMVIHGSVVIFLSGLLAGWLMGLLSWLVTAGRDTISQILIVWLITSAIGFSHLHHSIAGTIEVLVGFFSNQGITLANYGHFILWTTLGNSLGGVVFVAVIKYSHVIRSNVQTKDVKIENNTRD